MMRVWLILRLICAGWALFVLSAFVAWFAVDAPGDRLAGCTLVRGFLDALECGPDVWFGSLREFWFISPILPLAGIEFLTGRFHLWPMFLCLLALIFGISVILHAMFRFFRSRLE